MPFTFSHPIAIMPFKKFKAIKFSFTGLFFGSIAPDMEYFLRMRLESVYSETFTGFFIFNLPVTIISALIFHLLIRNVIIKNLPKPLDKNYSGLLNFDFIKYLGNNWKIFIISCVIGILSHLALDMFFDNQEISFAALSFSNLEALTGFITRRSLYVAERLFSLISLIALTWYLFSYKKYKQNDYLSLKATVKILFWSRVIITAILIAVIRVETSMYIFRLGGWITVLISGLMFSLILNSFYEKFVRGVK